MTTNGRLTNDTGADRDGGDEREARVLAAVRAYETELQAGRRPNRRELLARHPDIADDLAACLGGLTFVRAAAADMFLVQTLGRCCPRRRSAIQRGARGRRDADVPGSRAAPDGHGAPGDLRAIFIMLKIPRTPLVLIALFLLAVAAISPVPAHGELLIKPGDHVAICGDAAAGDTGYATFVAVERVPGVFSGQFGWATQSPQDLLKNLFDVTWGGHWKVDPNGHYGKWVNGTAGKQSKVILKMPPAQVGKLLDAELARPLK